MVIDATTQTTQNWDGTTAKSVLTALKVKVDDGEAANGNTSTGIVDISVENSSGSTLPETGGMGTTILYVVGGLLVVAAAVLLVTKKRVGADK